MMGVTKGVSYVNDMRDIVKCEICRLIAHGRMDLYPQVVREEADRLIW